MKAIFLTLTLTFSLPLIFQSSLRAQAPDINVDWGPIMKTRDSNFNYIIDADDNFFYTYGTHNGGILGAYFSGSFHIKKYDKKKFTLLYDLEVEKFEYQGKNAGFLKADLVNGEINLYFQVFHNSRDERTLIVRTVNEKGRIGEPLEIATVPAEKKNESSFVIFRSHDKSKLLIYSNLPYERREDEKFSIKVLDTSFNLLWEKDITLPYSDKYYQLEKQMITNDGQVFVVGYAEPDKYKGEKKQRKASNESYKLMRVTEDDSEIIEYDLDLDAKFISSIGLNVDFGNNSMAVAGFYSEKNKGSIAGSFFISFDQDKMKPLSASIEPFSKDFLKNFMSERRVKKGRELGSYVFRNFIRKKDGGAIIVAEQYYETVSTTQVNNGMGATSTVTTYYYHYNDIIVISIQPDGKIAWSSFIPKEQTSSNDGGFYSGYTLMLDDPQIHFIYNDNRKNLDRIAQGKDIKNLGNPKKSVSIIATVNENGQVSYDELFRNKDFRAIMVPKRSAQTEKDNELIIFGVRASKTRFGTLRF